MKKVYRRVPALLLLLLVWSLSIKETVAEKNRIRYEIFFLNVFICRIELPESNALLENLAHMEVFLLCIYSLPSACYVSQRVYKLVDELIAVKIYINGKVIVVRLTKSNTVQGVGFPSYIMYIDVCTFPVYIYIFFLAQKNSHVSV